MRVYHQEDMGRVQANGNQQDVILDPQGSVLGYVSENGFVYDSHHTLLGYVTKQGIVRAVDLRIVGQVHVRETFPFSAGRAAFFLLKQTEK
jgi:hypothetical protein